MELHEFIEKHLSEAGESPDALAERAGVARASVFRAKRRGGDPRISTVRQIVDAIGEPFVISPAPACEVEAGAGAVCAADRTPGVEPGGAAGCLADCVVACVPGDECFSMAACRVAPGDAVMR